MENTNEEVLDFAYAAIQRTELSDKDRETCGMINRLNRHEEMISKVDEAMSKAAEKENVKAGMESIDRGFTSYAESTVGKIREGSSLWQKFMDKKQELIQGYVEIADEVLGKYDTEIRRLTDEESTLRKGIVNSFAERFVLNKARKVLEQEEEISPKDRGMQAKDVTPSELKTLEEDKKIGAGESFKKIVAIKIEKEKVKMKRDEDLKKVIAEKETGLTKKEKKPNIFKKLYTALPISRFFKDRKIDAIAMATLNRWEENRKREELGKKLEARGAKKEDFDRRQFHQKGAEPTSLDRLNSVVKASKETPQVEQKQQEAYLEGI